MSQFSDSGLKSFTAGAAIGQHLRVVLSAGKLAKAGVSDRMLGTLEQAAFADLDVRSVRLRNHPGTRKMVASGAITALNYVYAGANGKVASSGTILEGLALETVTTDGDILEVLPVNNDFSAPVQSVTPDAVSGAGATILASSSRVTVGAVTNDANDWIVLPPIADVPIGWQIVICANAGGNFELRTPASSNTTINGQDCDGTKEYLCTDTDTIIVTKASATGWIGQSLTALGAVRTAVVPD